MSAAPNIALPASLERLRALFATRSGRQEVIAAQQAALNAFLAAGLPTSRDEPWKYTSLRRFESRTLSLPEPVSPVDPDLDAHLLNGAGWQRAVFVNGRYSAAHSTLEPVAGLRIRTLAALMKDSPHDAVALLGSDDVPVSARFDLVNRAFAEDGLVIDVTPGAEIAAPLYIVFSSAGAGRPTLSTPRIIVRMGAHARLALIEHHLSDDRAEHCVISSSQLTLAPGSQVDHYRLRQEGGQVIHLGSQSADVGRDARYANHAVSLGGTLARLDLAVRLTGSGASCESNGVFLADGTQHTDTHSCIEHVAPQTHSSQDYRGLADGKGRGVFNGKVKVHAGAQKTDARQSSRNLLLSKTAEIDARPELEIDTNDVKCSHGATAGQLDATALFYLRSRGIAEDEARGLLALAFVETVLQGMAIEPVRQHISAFFRQYFLAEKASA